MVQIAAEWAGAGRWVKMVNERCIESGSAAKWMMRAGLPVPAHKIQ
jgi:hypothetical protein